MPTLNMKCASYSKSKSKRRGATIVEFALLLPVLLTILLGIMEFGWLVKNHLTLANATRDGARAAAVGRPANDVDTRIKNLSSPLSLVSPSGSIVKQYSSDNGSTYTTWPGDTTDMSGVNTYNGVPVRSLLRITTTTKHQPLTGFFPFLKNRNLQVNVVMRREP